MFTTWKWAGACLWGGSPLSAGQLYKRTTFQEQFKRPQNEWWVSYQWQLLHQGNKTGLCWFCVWPVGSRTLAKAQRTLKNSPEIAKPRTRSWGALALAGLIIARLQRHYPLETLFLSCEGPGYQSLRPGCDCRNYPGLTLNYFLLCSHKIQVTLLLGGSQESFCRRQGMSSRPSPKKTTWKGPVNSQLATDLLYAETKRYYMALRNYYFYINHSGL